MLQSVDLELTDPIQEQQYGVGEDWLLIGILSTLLLGHRTLIQGRCSLGYLPIPLSVFDSFQGA